MLVQKDLQMEKWTLTIWTKHFAEKKIFLFLQTLVKKALKDVPKRSRRVKMVNKNALTFIAKSEVSSKYFYNVNKSFFRTFHLNDNLSNREMRHKMKVLKNNPALNWLQVR